MRRLDQWKAGLTWESVAPRCHSVINRTAEQVQHRLSEAKVEMLLQDHALGLSCAELTKKYGIHRVTVFEHLRRHGIEARTTMRKLCDEQALRAGQLYESRLSLNNIGKEVRANERTVRDAITRMGFAVGPRRGWAR